LAYSLTLILLSGPIASGKTTLAEHLGQLLSAEHISTSRLISATADGDLGRSELQRLGLSSALQRADWIISAVRQSTDRTPARTVIVVDAVRTLEQVRELRKTAAGIWRVLHVHLCGEATEFAARHEVLGRDRDSTWLQVMNSPAEAAVDELEAEADVVIDTTRSVPTDVAVRVAARIARRWLPTGPYVDVLVGGQWGSEG
jgi:adenylosuccinate synthase